MLRVSGWYNSPRLASKLLLRSVCAIVPFGYGSLYGRCYKQTGGQKVVSFEAPKQVTDAHPGLVYSLFGLYLGLEVPALGTGLLNCS